MAVARTLVAGRYRLLEPVGSGGMGRVWLARDEMLDREVAVKEFVPPTWLTEDERNLLRDRTLREARSAGRLNHPHVVRVYDVVHFDGLPWIVMEHVPSRSLQQVIKEDGPYSPAAAARIGLAVLEALTAAHRAGVLHRDVKPHNVLIGLDGRVVLTDFGLAMFVDDGSVTGPGLVVGSPQYVSPERARDGTSTVESDLWSLGATLYAAVEGRSPYARESAMSTLLALATEPPDPTERAGLLGPVLLGLLRHDPAARLTAAETERRLRMIIATTSATRAVVPRQRVSSESAPTPPSSSSSPRPRFVVAGLATVAVLGASGLLAGYLMQRDDDVAAPAPVLSASPSSSPPVSLRPVGFSPAVCGGPVPASAPTAPQKKASREVGGLVLLDGWSYFASSGFHVSVPDGWSYRRTGTMFCFRDPAGPRMLSLDSARNPVADPVKACRTEETRLLAAGALPDYQKISIVRKPLLNKAAEWEYRYTAPDGTRMHARTRWFASGGRAYALSWATREIDWPADLSKINMVMSTFYADPRQS